WGEGSRQKAKGMALPPLCILSRPLTPDPSPARGEGRKNKTRSDGRGGPAGAPGSLEDDPLAGLGRRLAAGRLRSLGAAAADRRVVDHETAGAAAVHAGGDAIAAGLDHLAALLVAAGAGHHEAAVGHLAPTHAHREVARTAHHAVAHAAAA